MLLWDSLISIIFTLGWIVCASDSGGNDQCQRMTCALAKRLPLQALTSNKEHFTLIISNCLFTIPLTAFNESTHQLAVQEANSTLWSTVSWMEKAVKKLSGTFQKLLHFQMIACVHPKPLMHLVVSNERGATQELYWHSKNPWATYFYSVDQKGDIPRAYHSISDGHNRSYTFTWSHDLTNNQQKRQNLPNEVVLIPFRRRQAVYWFRLAVNKRRTEVTFHLYGDPQLVPDDRRSISRKRSLFRQLPYGFIFKNNVYLIQGTTVFIMPYVDISNPYKILDFTRQQFPLSLPLTVKRLKNFFLC